MPSASQSSWKTTPGLARRHQREAVAVPAVAVDVGDRHVEHRGERRHRGERLAAVDGPAAVDPGRRGRRPGEVLRRRLAGRGGEHDVGLHHVAQDVAEPLAPCASSPRSMATRHERTRLISPARCMFTPIVVAGSPRASRDDATRTSWAEATPPPPRSVGHRRDQEPVGAELLEVLDGEAAVAVVGQRAVGELGREAWSRPPPSRRRRGVGVQSAGRSVSNRLHRAHHRGCSARMPSTDLPTSSWVSASLPGWKPPQRTSR